MAAISDWKGVLASPMNSSGQGPVMKAHQEQSIVTSDACHIVTSLQFHS